jgi:hypothetical protein
LFTPARFLTASRDPKNYKSYCVIGANAICWPLVVRSRG